MDLLFGENIFGEQLARSISWTLVHSLWQGMAAAILAMLIMATTKKAAASLRYNLLLTTLLLFCGAVVTTFFLQPGVEITNDVQGYVVAGTTLVQNQPVVSTGDGQGAVTSIFSFLNANSQIIVFAWLLLTIAKLTQLFVGCWGISRIAKTQVSNAGDFWNERMSQLAASIRVTKPVRLLQSALVATPTVVSYFKPIILVPAGLLTSLPQKEVEAILLHELSHIRRKDFLVNLLQNFVETIFFFNPFVHWISNLVREERENCCDDTAVAHLENKTTLIKAMIACMEFKGKESSSYALAFGGRQRQLLNRVKRIVNKTPRPFRATEKVVLGLCIPLAVMLGMFLLQAFQPKSSGAIPHSSTVLYDTIPKKSAGNDDEMSGTVKKVNGVDHHYYSFKRKNGSYEVEKVKGLIVSLKVNGRTIAKEKIQDHATTINPLIDEYDNIMKQPFTGLSPLAATTSATLSADSLAAAMVPVSGLRGELAGISDLADDKAKSETPATRATNYYDNGYRVVVQDSIVTKVFYKGKLLTHEQVKARQADIDAIFKGRQDNTIYYKP